MINLPVPSHLQEYADRISEFKSVNRIDIRVFVADARVKDGKSYYVPRSIKVEIEMDRCTKFARGTVTEIGFFLHGVLFTLMALDT